VLSQQFRQLGDIGRDPPRLVLVMRASFVRRGHSGLAALTCSCAVARMRDAVQIAVVFEVY
jgi:hypothetical protein